MKKSLQIAFLSILSLNSVGAVFSYGQDEIRAREREKIQNHFDSGRIKEAREAILQLPKEERLEWLDSLYDFSSNDSSQADSNSPDRNGRSELAAAQGGGSLANFGDLINLIESTVEGDWSNLGAGDAQILPFYNGVFVDAKGTMQRISPEANEKLRLRWSGRSRLDWSHLGEWQAAVPLRWISLDELDEQLSASRKEETTATLAMQVMGGLVRIDYLAFDKETNSWLVGGPAGGLVQNDQGDLVHKDLRLPPVLLEDVLTVAIHVFNRRGPFGCSIDPDANRLVKAYQVATQPDAQRLLRRSPTRWIEEWRKELGPQETKVVGLPSSSPTAIALLKADAEMKRMGLGLDPLPPTVRTYWQEADLLQGSVSNSMVRWWYTLNRSKIPYDKARKIYQLTGRNVRIQSEAQFINAQGERVVAANPDFAADAFAKNFNDHQNQIQKMSAVQGRLRHIFDLAVAFELIKNEMDQGNGKDLIELSNLENLPKSEFTPRAIESIAATHASRNGTLSAAVSGGVHVSTQGVTDAIQADSYSLKSLTYPADDLLQHKKTTREGALSPREVRKLPFWFEGK